MIRGRTTGRRLKRNMFKHLMFHLTCGAALLFIGVHEDDALSFSNYIIAPKFGMSIQSLTWAVSILGVLMAVYCALAVKYWASLSTSREILGDTIRIYLGLCVLWTIFGLWYFAVLIKTFKHIKGNEWNSTVELSTIYPVYISSLIFLLPYLVFTVLYALDFSYLLDELNLGGNIEEPDPPEFVLDFSQITLRILFLNAMLAPLVVCIQTSDVCTAIYKRCKPKKDELRPSLLKRRNIFFRIFRTIVRCCKKTKALIIATNTSVAVVPENKDNDKLETQLRTVEKDKEERERLEQERIQEERARQEELEKQKVKEQAEELKRQEEESKRAAEEERLRLEAEEKKKLEEEEAKKRVPTMSVHMYKALWTTLGTGGSFQCKLKSMPTLQTFTEHMKNQGFHTVFAVNPNADDIEVGICNIRQDGTGPWFMARFLASNLSFSAVMKCEMADEVTKYVKKFALAKVLKIDTSK